MCEPPFELSIKRTLPGGRTEKLLCEQYLRVVAGRREVLACRWNGKCVVAKVFSRRTGSARRLRREWYGLCELRSRGLSVPEPLFYGTTEDGRRAVVVEKIVGWPTALDAFNNAADEQQRTELLTLLCRELAREHEKGVVQADLHLDNFMIAGQKVLLLDPAQIRFFASPVPRDKSISQLALLARYLPGDDTDSARALCREYFKARGWSFERRDEAIFKHQTHAHTRRTIRRGLKKCLRTNKRQIRIRNSRYVAVFDREFCRDAEPQEFVAQVDGLMAKGEVLKDGNTCYISRLTWNGHDVVVKRYNHKGLIHSLRHTLKTSRARQGWRHAHRLGILGVSTPKPLAYIERRKGPLVWSSYLVTEYTTGRKLYYFLRDGDVPARECSATLDQVGQVLTRLAEYGITHGDLKPSNILLGECGPVLTDLDSMRAHRLKRTFKRRRAKDMQDISRLCEQITALAAGADSRCGG